MSTRDHYLDGLSLGYEYAQADRAAWAPLGANAQVLRMEAAEERDSARTWRAFKLGIARGYRANVRTLERGRWGA